MWLYRGMSQPPTRSAQAVLLELPEGRPAGERAPASGPPKLRPIHRDQRALVPLDVEELIGADHKARAIWELAGKLDLSGFRETIRTAEGEAGRAAWDPRLLVSLWVYAYSEGISSAREIERMMSYEPGLRWLAGLEVINHHTLSDFRVEHRAALDELFAGLLAILQEQELVSLERVMQDGTKIRAQGGADTFRRGRRLEEHLEEARRAVAEMGDPREEGRSRREAAQQRAKRERAERLEQALQQLEQIRASQRTAQQKQEARASWSEPEARIMKHGDGALAPSYNLQISTDAAKKAIVAVELSQSSSDANLLEPAIAAIENNTGAKPEQVVADGGYTNQGTIVALAEQKVDFIGSLPDPKRQAAAALKALGIDPAFGPEQFRFDAATNSLLCPAGQRLPYRGQSRKRGRLYWQYRAAASDCSACPYRSQCCPRAGPGGRTVSRLQQEHPHVAAFREKMATAEAQAIYRQRGEVAEFPNAWIKQKLGLRKFCLRGLAKARLEAVWACLTYNVMLWVRMVWRRSLEMAAG